MAQNYLTSYHKKCYVLGCDSVSSMKGVRFHRFPRNKSKATVWMTKTNRNLLKFNVCNSRRHIICSKHFDRHQYQNKHLIKLNRNAMPTLNLPYDEIRDDQFSIVYDQSTEDGAIVKKIEVENPPVEATVKPASLLHDPRAAPAIIPCPKRRVADDDIASFYITLKESGKLEEVTLEDPLRSNPNPEIIHDELDVELLDRPSPSVDPELPLLIDVPNDDISAIDDIRIKTPPFEILPTPPPEPITQCRICFASGTNMINIFQFDTDQINFYTKYRLTFVDLEMENTLDFDIICEKCCLSIRQVYHFKSLCKEGNAQVIMMSKAKQIKEYGEGKTFPEPIGRKETEVVESDADADITTEDHLVDDIIKTDVIDNDPSILRSILEQEPPANEEEQRFLSKYIHCSFCQTKFLNIDLLRAHMKAHLTNTTFTIKLYKCGLCPSKFINTNSLIKHKRVVHSEERIRKKIKNEARAAYVVAPKPKPKRPKRDPFPEPPVEERVVLPCPDCKKIFYFPHVLAKHQENHARTRERQMKRQAVPKELKFLCEVCGKAFKYRKNYEIHVAGHSDAKPCVCETCGKAFRHSFNLKNHMTTHDLVKKFVCEICGMAYRLKTSLKAHLMVHSGEMPYTCQICDKKFRFASSHRSHLRRHTGERPYKCNYEGCTADYTDKTHLNRHKLKTHIRKKEHVCTDCGMSFYFRFSLRQHQEKHGNMEKIYNCDSCDKSFALLSTLRKHKRYHKTAGIYTCEFCQKTFKQPIYLRQHIDKVHNKNLESAKDPDAVPECLVCNRTFQSDFTLRLHMKIHQSPKERPSRIDDVERTVPCDRCDKRFKSDSHLKVHMRLHTQEKPYSCDVCGKTFAQSIALRLHRFTHTGEKVYSCEMCHKKFRQPGHLQAHRNWHFGIKPHECSFCFRQYSQKRDLRLHMEKMHSYELKPEPFGDDISQKAFSEQFNEHIYSKIENDNQDFEENQPGLSLSPIE